MAKIDLTGKEYQYFKVIDRNNERKGKNVWWNCLCHCGKTFIATTTEINKGTRKSCGCMKSKLLSEAHLQDLTGQQFGKLTVLRRDFDHPQNGQKVRTYWVCQCECGNVVSIERTHLVNRNQTSCGCVQSIEEYNIHKLLSNNGIKYKAQYTNNDLKTEKNGYLRFDFAILDEQNNVVRLIEFDGPQHNNSEWYGEEVFIQQKEYDNRKNIYAKQCGIDLIRIPYYKRNCLSLDDILGECFIQ